jgi:hypothetical protein
MKTAIIYTVVGVAVLIFIILLATGAFSSSPNSTLPRSNTPAGNVETDTDTDENTEIDAPVDPSTMSTAPTCTNLLPPQSDPNPVFRQSPIISPSGPGGYCLFSHDDLASGYDGLNKPPDVNLVARDVWGPPPLGHMFSTTCVPIVPTREQAERTGCSRGVTHLGKIMWYNKHGVNLGPTNHNCTSCTDLSPMNT